MDLNLIYFDEFITSYPTNSFKHDLNLAKPAESLVKSKLEELKPDWDFDDVSDNSFYYHKGDIKATKDGREVMIEVKDDSCIGTTGNVLCEEFTKFYDTGEVRKGNFYSNYEIYCVVSKDTSTFYLFDFSILKKIYKNYRSKIIKHPTQENLVYFVPITEVEKYGGLISKIEY